MRSGTKGIAGESSKGRSDWSCKEFENGAMTANRANRADISCSSGFSPAVVE